MSHSSWESLNPSSWRIGMPSTPSISQTLNSSVKASVDSHSTRPLASGRIGWTFATDGAALRKSHTCHEGPLHVQEDVAGDFLDREDPQALGRLAPGAVLRSN